MTDTMIDLPGVIAKSDDADFLRELIQDAAQRLMDIEVAAVCGAGYGQDRIANFQNKIDAIYLDAALLVQANPVASDLIQYAGRTSDGFLILDFGNSDTLTFTGVTNTGAILDEVSFV